jgi:hypothetical protein
MITFGKPPLALLNDNEFSTWTSHALDSSFSVVELQKDLDQRQQKLEALRDYMRQKPTGLVVALGMITNDSVERDFRNHAAIMNFIGFFVKEKGVASKLKLLMPSLPVKSNPALHAALTGSIESFVRVYNQQSPSPMMSIVPFTLPLERLAESPKLPPLFEEKIISSVGLMSLS